jgi:hypothetical protein
MSVHGFTRNIASIGGDLMLIEDKMQKYSICPKQSAPTPPQLGILFTIISWKFSVGVVHGGFAWLKAPQCDNRR